MITPTTEIESAFAAFLIAALPDLGIPQEQVEWPNAKNVPNPSLSYLRPTLMFGQTVTASLGIDGFERLIGIYQISVFVPKDSGTAQANKWASQLVEVFRGGTRISVCGSDLVISTAYRSGALSEEERYHIPVSVNWYYYVNKG